MPFSAHFFISLALIRLELLVISTCEGPIPWQNIFKPPPDPVLSTEIKFEDGIKAQTSAS